jgi:amidase
MSELWQLSASEMASRIAAEEVSATDVVLAHLGRISAINPKLNAIVDVLRDSALTTAAAADIVIASGVSVGPLHGVPFTIKENIDVANAATTWGVPSFAKAIVWQDAPAVERMRRAGAIPIGRTNMPDLGLRAHTESSLHGITLNPWERGRTAGGSSGGDASAVASGMAPLGLATDLGGSLRNPASACGVVTLQPTVGRVPDAGLVPSEDRLLALQLMKVVGPIARNVADIKLVLRVLMGAHPRDPWSINVGVTPTIPQPIRVAVMSSPPGGQCERIIVQAVENAADALANAGYEVVEVTPPHYEEAVSLWGKLLLADYSSGMQKALELMGPSSRAFLKNALDIIDPPRDVASISDLHIRRDRIARSWAAFFQDCPLLLSPTWTQLPFPHGFDAESRAGAEATLEMIRPVLPSNLLGLPSVCVPAARDQLSGLPVGVQLTAARFNEDLCLAAAEIVEKVAAVTTPVTPDW